MSSLEQEDGIEVQQKDWRAIVLSWLANQSFPAIMLIAVMYGVWLIATDVAPKEFRALIERQSMTLETSLQRVIGDFNTRISEVVASHDRDRAMWEKAIESSERDRQLMLELLREQLKLTKSVESRMP